MGLQLWTVATDLDHLMDPISGRMSKKSFPSNQGVARRIVGVVLFIFLSLVSLFSLTVLYLVFANKKIVKQEEGEANRVKFLPSQCVEYELEDEVDDDGNVLERVLYYKGSQTHSTTSKDERGLKKSLSEEEILQRTVTSPLSMEAAHQFAKLTRDTSELLERNLQTIGEDEAHDLLSKSADLREEIGSPEFEYFRRTWDERETVKEITETLLDRFPHLKESARSPPPRSGASLKRPEVKRELEFFSEISVPE